MYMRKGWKIFFRILLEKEQAILDWGRRASYFRDSMAAVIEFDIYH